MIFVTVGHQTPFDRLIRAVDRWAAHTGRGDLFAQLGKTTFKPNHFPGELFITPHQFRQCMSHASAVVGHAGTGTIIAALQFGKPLLVLPRLSRLGETRNDHQVPTAEHFARSGHILAAFDEDEFIQKMNEIESFVPCGGIDGQASPQLLQRLREFAFIENVHANRCQNTA